VLWVCTVIRHLICLFTSPYLICTFDVPIFKSLFNLPGCFELRLSSFCCLGICNNNFLYWARSSALHPTPTWGTRSVYLCSPVTGWPSYNPRHWIAFLSSSVACRATVEVFYPVSTWDRSNLYFANSIADALHSTYIEKMDIHILYIMHN
jgi:hypothetical protein